MDHPVHVQVPEHLTVGTDEITLRVTSDATAGALLAADVRLPAGGGPPMLHRHEPAEVYRIQHGELALYIEDDSGDVQRIAAEPGAVVHIPGGRAHTVRNESDDEAHAYVVFTPGTAIERFIRQAATLAAAGPPDIEEILALAEQHGIEMAGPLPADAPAQLADAQASDQLDVDHQLNNTTSRRPSVHRRNGRRLPGVGTDFRKCLAATAQPKP
jgi:mannose-6-phosphate isomerase-like protein (cupin superfamily)